MHLSPSFGAKFFVHAQLDFSIQSSILGYPFQLIFVCTKIQTFLVTTSIRVCESSFLVFMESVILFINILGFSSALVTKLNTRFFYKNQ